MRALLLGECSKRVFGGKALTSRGLTSMLVIFLNRVVLELSERQNAPSLCLRILFLSFPQPSFHLAIHPQMRTRLFLRTSEFLWQEGLTSGAISLVETALCTPGLVNGEI